MVSKCGQLLNGRSLNAILLDIELPGEDGFELTKRIRSESDIVIVIVSSRNEDIDRIIGLELGADDYVAKPFTERELLVRVKNLLKRRSKPQSSQDSETKYQFNGWTLCNETRSLTSPFNEKEHLTNGEFQLLLSFAENTNKGFNT